MFNNERWSAAVIKKVFFFILQMLSYSMRLWTLFPLLKQNWTQEKWRVSWHESLWLFENHLFLLSTILNESLQ